MRIIPVFVATFLLAQITAGCAVTHETTNAQVELDESVARSQASALSAALAAASSGDGVSIADAITKIGDTASALVAQGKGGAGRARPGAGATTCTCDAAAKRCAFEACTLAGATVSGTVTWGGGKIVCDGMTVDAAGTHATLACSLTYTDKTLAGTVHTTGSAAVSGTTYAWDATLTAASVTVTSGKVTGGSLDVSANVDVTTTSSGTKAYAASAVVALE